MRRDYEIPRRGDDTAKPIQRGRAVFDAHLTLGDATVTSAGAGFAADTDVGAVVMGVGIPPGTTIASVTNATTVELSVPATKTCVLTREFLVPRTPFKGLVIQAVDLSGWTFTSDIRREPQSTGAVLGSAEVNTDNAVTGLLLWVVRHGVSAVLPEHAHYDLQGVRTADGWKQTFQWGELLTPPDVTRG